MPHLPVAAGLGTAQATVLLAAIAALAHLLLVSTPRPMDYLGWIVGLATAAAAVAEGVVNLVIGSLVTGTASRAR